MYRSSGHLEGRVSFKLFMKNFEERWSLTRRIGAISVDGVLRGGRYA